MFKRTLQIVALCVFGLTALGASSTSTRFDHLGHEMICQCGCGQVLLECNHVGCPVSPVMIGELQTQLATTLPDAGVLNFFIAKYGPIVLAAPIRGGFDNVAWIVPFAALLFATVGVALLIRLWHRRRTVLVPAGSFEDAVLPHVHAAGDDNLAARIRRETDYDNFGPDFDDDKKDGPR